MKQPPHCIVSLYGWTYWMPILLAGVGIMVVGIVAPGWWPLSVMAGVVTLAALAFFRDFERSIPGEPGVMVAPADGKVTEITRLERYEPFGGPALRVGIFLSVLDVHINRSPCDAVVLATEYREGLFLDARDVESGPKNQSNTLTLGDPATRRPVAVVKQIVGAIARRIIAPVAVGDTLARGERFGMIAFGSRTELYVPEGDGWEAAVSIGTHVHGGMDVLLRRKR